MNIAMALIMFFSVQTLNFRGANEKAKFFLLPQKPLQFCFLRLLNNGKQSGEVSSITSRNLIQLSLNSFSSWEFLMRSGVKQRWLRGMSADGELLLRFAIERILSDPFLRGHITKCSERVFPTLIRLMKNFQFSSTASSFLSQLNRATMEFRTWDVLGSGWITMRWRSSLHFGRFIIHESWNIPAPCRILHGSFLNFFLFLISKTLKGKTRRSKHNNKRVS